jgi:hypothetical protein
MLAEVKFAGCCPVVIDGRRMIQRRIKVYKVEARGFK